MSDSPAAVVGKLGLGIGVGFAIYYFISGLGFGGHGGGTGEGPGTTPIAPRPPDSKRLSFVMQEPGVVGRPMAFRLRDDDPSTKTYTLDETIARIKAGGRSDMSLWIRGNVIQGSADKAKALLEAAGITVWKEVGPTPTPTPTASPHVAGNARGRYGRRSW